MLLFTADGGNIDCIHPVQEVVDRLCGDEKLAQAHRLETWFEGYANMRGTTARTFKPLKSCVRGPDHSLSLFNRKQSNGNIVDQSSFS